MRSRHAVSAALVVLAGLVGCGREEAASPARMKARIEVLERERDALGAKLGDLVARDPRFEGMPGSSLRVGVPTSLARTLIQRVVGGFVDSVTLKLANLRVHKAGTVRKIITIGDYDLDVVIDEVSGRLKTGKPEVAFGGNSVTVALPVRVVNGRGDATIDFKWSGKNVSGAACGDMEVHQTVSGTVKPDTYHVQGGMLLTATTQRILVSPKFPVVRVNLKVEPSQESWAAVQRILDSKEGVCGFVLDKVDIKGALERLIGKGFDVRLPTEKIKPMVVPVGLAPTITVRGAPVTLGVKVDHLTITEHMIWLGAEVSSGGPDDATPKT
jgi:hypothetical protein